MEKLNIFFMAHAYPNVDPRRKLEHEDFNRIPPVDGAMANMPRKAAHYEWPKPRLHVGDLIGER